MQDVDEWNLASQAVTIFAKSSKQCAEQISDTFC